MDIGDLTGGNRTWVRVSVRSIRGAGRLNPRLVLALKLATPNDRVAAELRDVKLRLALGEEVVGEAQLIGERAEWYGSETTVEIPVSHPTIDYVTNAFGQADAMSLQLRWYGLMRVRWEPTESDAARLGEPESGEWTDYPLPLLQHEHYLQVSRSTWFAQILEPIRQEDYVYLEVAIPRGESASAWHAALGNLAAADKAFTLGDDAAVFQHLRAVLDAMPGANQHIVDRLPEPRRTEVDKLLRAAGDYLHHGRHVATVGANAGSFPVDHQDADFALSLVRVFLSYLPRALAASESDQ